jgi:hypothetical protein
MCCGAAHPGRALIAGGFFILKGNASMTANERTAIRRELERDRKAASLAVCQIRRSLATLNFLNPLSGGGDDRARLTSALANAEAKVARLEREIVRHTTDADRWAQLREIDARAPVTKPKPAFRKAPTRRTVPSYVTRMIGGPGCD